MPEAMLGIIGFKLLRSANSSGVGLYMDGSDMVRARPPPRREPASVGIIISMFPPDKVAPDAEAESLELPPSPAALDELALVLGAMGTYAIVSRLVPEAVADWLIGPLLVPAKRTSYVQ